MAQVSRAFIVSSVNRVEKHIVRVLTGKKLVDLPPPALLLAAMTEKQRLMYPGFIMLAADATDAPVYVPGSQAERGLQGSSASVRASRRKAFQQAPAVRWPAP